MRKKLALVIALVESIRSTSRSAFGKYLTEAINKAAAGGRLPLGFKARMEREAAGIFLKRAFVSMHEKAKKELDKIGDALNAIDYDLTALTDFKGALLPGGVAEFVARLGLDADTVKTLNNDKWLDALAGIRRKREPMARLEAYLRLCALLIRAYAGLTDKIEKLAKRRETDAGAEGAVANVMKGRLETVRDLVWARLRVAACLFFTQRRCVFKTLVAYTTAFKDKWPAFPSETIAEIVKKEEMGIDRPLRILAETEAVFATLPAKMLSAARRAAK